MNSVQASDIIDKCGLTVGFFLVFSLSGMRQNVVSKQLWASKSPADELRAVAGRCEAAAHDPRLELQVPLHLQRTTANQHAQLKQLRILFVTS
jgi:hypothetical protein